MMQLITNRSRRASRGLPRTSGGGRPITITIYKCMLINHIVLIKQMQITNRC